MRCPVVARLEHQLRQLDQQIALGVRLVELRERRRGVLALLRTFRLHACLERASSQRLHCPPLPPPRLRVVS